MGLLMTCSVCQNMAHYIYRITKESGIAYCDKHLPKFLEGRKKAGLLEKTSELKTVVEESMPNIVYASPEPTEEASVAETPKKRATKKKAE